MYFSDPTEVYDTLGALMGATAHSGGIGAQLRATDTVVQFLLTEPTAQITVVLSEDQEPTATFGDTTLQATVVLEMSADTAHEIFLGKSDLMLVANRGLAKIRGESAKLLGAWTAIQYALPERYAQLLEVGGHGDLVLE